MCDDRHHHHHHGGPPSADWPGRPRDPFAHSHDMPHSHEPAAMEEGDEVDELKEHMLEITEESFQELLKERTKKLLEARVGKRLDRLAEIVVDYYLAQHAQEIAAINEDYDFDDRFRDELANGLLNDEED